MSDTYIDEVVRFRAACAECGWHGKVRKSYPRALDDEQDHNDEKHSPDRPADVEIGGPS